LHSTEDDTLAHYCACALYKFIIYITFTLDTLHYITRSTLSPSHVYLK